MKSAQTFPMLAFSQRPRPSLHLSRGPHEAQKRVHFLKFVTNVPRKGRKALVKPKLGQLLGDPQTNGVHIIHRQAPDQIELGKEGHYTWGLHSANLEEKKGA